MDIANHKHIIFCGDGTNALGLIRGLGENGIKSILIEEEGCEGLARHSKYVKERICSKSWDEAFYILISRFSNEKEKPFLYCCDDGAAAFLDSRYDKIKEAFYFDNAGSQGAICRLQQKTVQISIAESVGFKVPNSEIVSRGELPLQLQYPVFTKTLDSLMPGWKNEYRIIGSPEEFLAEWDSIKSDKLLVQEYIDKKNEIEFHGFSSPSEVFLCPQKDYFRFSKKGFGHYMKLHQANDPTLLDKCKKLIKAFNYCGLFDIELIEDPKGQYWFTEVNLRSTMTMYCFSPMGVCVHALWAQSFLNDSEIGKISCSQPEFTAIDELPDFFDSVVHGDITLKKWLKEYFSADVRLLWNSKDIWPFFVAMHQKNCRLIHNFLKIAN